MYIIGDIGNTEIKLSLLNSKFDKIKNLKLKTQLINSRYLNKKMKNIKRYFPIIKSCLFCSVVPTSYIKFKTYFKKYSKIKCFELKNQNIKNLIKIKVNKNQVGSDRIANAIGALDNKNNFIIIDFGTATTFDVIKKNTYMGGIIAPGIEISLDNLIKKASLIPRIKFTKTKKIIGLNTISSVRSGFYWGYVGLINKLVELIKTDTKLNYKIVLTGGLSHLFKNSLKVKSTIDKEITLNGLIKTLKFIKI